MESRLARRAVVRGLVQGVFFRVSCRDEARRLGLAGWVRNRPDGSVEALLEGEPTRIDAMLRWLWRGPELAQVTDVEVSAVPAAGLRGFEIR